MRVERALLEELSEKKFNIGYQGEQNHTQVIISCPVMFRDYPDAVASMVVKPPQGDLYPVSLTRDGNDLTWDVSDADVAIPGEGILQLTFTDGEGEEAEIIKTVYGSYSVNASLVANGEAPDPVQSWLDEAGAALATFENEIGDIRKITTATEEDEGLALSPKTVVNGKVTEWEYIDLADPEVVTQAIDDWLDDHPEATTTVEDGAITEAKLNDSLKEDLAWQDDVDELKSAIKRPEFIVGNAEEVLSDRGESDEAVYLFRKTGGNAKAYNREQVKRLVGGTVAWNQLASIPVTSQSKTENNVTIVDNRDGTYTVSTTAEGASELTYYSLGGFNVISGHKYMMRSCPPGGSMSTYRSYMTSNVTGNVNDTGNGVIYNATGTGASYFVAIYIYSGAIITTPVVFKPQLFDLTEMFGSTIADYLYTLETQTAGSGGALFRSLFGKSFYQFNSGSLESVNVSEHRLTGKNLAYKSSGNNLVIANVKPGTYTLSIKNTGEVGFNIKKTNSSGQLIAATSGATTANPVVLHFDVDEECSLFLNGYAVTGAFADKTSDFMLVLGSTAADYEPYAVSTYALPNVTLRGIPKLVNNEIVFDGDELTPDGTVKRRYGIVDLGSLTWEKVTTSGDNYWFRANKTDVRISNSGNAIPNIICTKYTTIPSNSAYVGTTGITLINLYSYIAVCDTSYSDAATFKTAMSGVYLVYELATPTTESADPYQELQICNRYGTEEYVDRLTTAETSPRDVSIPCGHQTFYPVNVFDYIDELTKPDADFIADANIQSGKYFSVGNGLYISTQAIAQGTAIVPGTNCTEVSLPDALNALNT